ncbi:MAG: beta-ketoacyl-ACP synthase II, partial [Planctomycetota bacterium]
MMGRRVVITGLGAVTPIGITPEKLWESIVACKNGIDAITCLDTTNFTTKIGGEVKDFDPTKWIDEREVKKIDRFAQFAVAASEMAVQEAGIDFSKEDTMRAGAIIGSGIGGFQEVESTSRKIIEKGPGRISPFFIPKLMMNSASGQIAIKHGITGPNFGIASACASANHAMGMALYLIAMGNADIIITGGAEAAITELGLGGFCACKALSTRNDDPEHASRPFDKNRDGFVLGEGAGVLIFEELEHAKKRGADIYAEVLGFGMSDDAFHITAPREDGKMAAAAITQAIQQAHVNTEEVSYVNAHGTSTYYNDISETIALKMALGEHAKKIGVSSTKSQMGHLLGAAAGAELVVTILAIKHGVMPPTINYEVPDPQCDLDYVPNEPREAPINIA